MLSNPSLTRPPSVRQVESIVGVHPNAANTPTRNVSLTMHHLYHCTVRRWDLIAPLERARSAAWEQVCRYRTIIKGASFIASSYFITYRVDGTNLWDTEALHKMIKKEMTAIFLNDNAPADALPELLRVSNAVEDMYAWHLHWRHLATEVDRRRCHRDVRIEGLWRKARAFAKARRLALVWHEAHHDDEAFKANVMAACEASMKAPVYTEGALGA